MAIGTGKRSTRQASTRSGEQVADGARSKAVAQTPSAMVPRVVAHVIGLTKCRQVRSRLSRGSWLRCALARITRVRWNGKGGGMPARPGCALIMAVGLGSDLTPHPGYRASGRGCRPTRFRRPDARCRSRGAVRNARTVLWLGQSGSVRTVRASRLGKTTDVRVRSAYPFVNR